MKKTYAAPAVAATGNIVRETKSGPELVQEDGAIGQFTAGSVSRYL